MTISILCLMIFSGFSIPHDHKLYGVWKASDENAFIEFSNDHYVSFTMKSANDTLIFGGKHYMHDSFAACMKYETSDSSDPQSIDMVVYRLSDMKEINRSRGIFYFTDEKTLQLCINFDGEKRSHAQKEGECVMFRKEQ